MAVWSDIRSVLKKALTLNPYSVALLVLIVLGIIVIIEYASQVVVEKGSLPPVDRSFPKPKEQYEIAKLAAEIRRIRSDTVGSLFWLKMIALFVTVGGAVGGYLLGQSQTTQKRIDFENTKNVDAVYQAIVQELSDDKSPVLRAAAAVKLGNILKSFPPEWNVSKEKRQQLVTLTKRVLAAALAIEDDRKVLKTLTSVLVLHKPWENGNPHNQDRKGYADLREIDLSIAKARDAYWAKVDFSYGDFYRADVRESSFRNSILYKAQFRETNLQNAVLVEANCEEAFFKLTDLRGANLAKVNLHKAKFENAKVHGANTDDIIGRESVDNPDAQVDNSEKADGSDLRSVQEWLFPHPTHPEPTIKSSLRNFLGRFWPPTA